MKIFLIRHGQTKIVSEKAILTERGIMEAKFVGKELSKYNFSRVYTSDLIRSEDTAKEYFKFAKTKKLIKTEKLREIYRVLIGGPIKSNSPEDRERKDKESADKIFEELLKEKKNVLVFCHGNIIKYFLNKVMKSKENLWEGITINNCSISILEFEKNKLSIKTINLIGHLPEESKREIYNSDNREIYLP